MEHQTGPLAGIVVADFSRILAGPLATMTPADMGGPGCQGRTARQWGRYPQLGATLLGHRFNLLRECEPEQGIGVFGSRKSGGLRCGGG